MDAPRLRQLIQDYGRLTRLEEMSPQARGQSLNGLLADVLRCWGISANANQLSRGEIDVQFGLSSGHRFILEAKWQQGRVDTGVISKLQKRVRQRLAGTMGIMASMSGFTAQAIADVKDGERLEILLLDATHIEAMLSGFVPPGELLNRLLDRASFRGDCFTPLHELMKTDRTFEQLDFTTYRAPLVEPPDVDLDARIVVRGLPSRQHGLFSPQPGHLWVTTEDALLDVAADEQSTSTAVAIPDLSRSASSTDTGYPFVLRRAGAAIVRGDDIQIVAGGLSGNTTPVVGTNGKWIFCNSYDPAATHGAVFVRHDGALGSQDHIELDYPAAHGTNAGLAGDELIVVGNAGLLRVPVHGGEHEPPVRFPGVNPMGMMWHGSGRWIVAAGEVDLYELEVGSWAARRFASFHSLRGAVSELAACTESDEGFLYSHLRAETSACIVQFTVPR